MTTPDHVENTADNLRRAAEVQEKAQQDDTQAEGPIDEQSVETPLPDFNT